MNNVPQRSCGIYLKIKKREREIVHCIFLTWAICIKLSPLACAPLSSVLAEQSSLSLDPEPNPIPLPPCSDADKGHAACNGGG